MAKPVVILANGRFPVHEIAQGYLKAAGKIICCDGAVANLDDYGLEPSAIVGDLDSLTPGLAEKYSDRLYCDENQDTNDLTKAVEYCLKEGIKNVVILGATGLREDHTIGNISLLAEYAESLSIMMVSDYGFIIPVRSGSRISSWAGQQVSVFAIDKETRINSNNLKYPLNNLEIENLWMGTLNECMTDYFELTFETGRVLVFLGF